MTIAGMLFVGSLSVRLFFIIIMITLLKGTELRVYGGFT